MAGHRDPTPVRGGARRWVLALAVAAAVGTSPSCIPDSGACTANSDCCGGYCDPQTLTCVTIIL